MIAVFFGGRSCEHDISIITGLQALSACKRSAIGVYIDGEGAWHASDTFDSVNAVRNGRFKSKPVYLRPGEPYLYCKNRRLYKISAALLCVHGTFGEDGSLQGLLELSGIPYTGGGILASAIGMNKLYSKRIFEAAGLSVLPYAPITHEAYVKDAYAAVTPILDKIEFPMIVKPCNLGSSIGITVADNLNDLYSALRIAFEWDDTAIVEKALVGFTEVNCAVLGDENDCTPSETEQPVGWKTFLTFSDKYSGDVKSTRHKIPADIGTEKNERVKELAISAFKAVGCSGVARVDFLIKDDDIYINEINTIPGSLSNALFKEDMNYSTLIDTLIEIAEKRKKRSDRLRRSYTPLEPIAGK